MVFFLEPLINFARVAVTASAADATVSALATDWRRTDPGDTPELHEWYYELLHACGPRYTAPVTMAIGGTPARGATESHDLGGGILGQALKDLAANTGVMAKRKDTGYKPHELDLLFRICGTPIRVDSEPSAADLPAFWQDFDKHRGKITDARSYIERHFATYSTGANLDQVIFSTNFIQDLMVNDLDGRDKFCEFKLRHRGFSLFAVGPIDINHMTGETQRREFVRQETSTLKLDETIALEKKSDQITKQLITWPKNLLEFRRYMHHMQRICVIFFGDTFLPARHFRLMHDVSQKSHYFSSYTKTHYWSLMWQLHMAFRQYFLDGIAVLFEQLYSDIFRFRLPSSELLPADLKNSIQPVPPYVSDTGSTAGSSISDLSDSQHQPPTKKAKVVEFDGGQVFSSEIQYLKTKVSNFDPARVADGVFPGGTMDRIMGQDFKACVNGRQPCFKYLILGDCETFCRDRTNFAASPRLASLTKSRRASAQPSTTTAVQPLLLAAVAVVAAAVATAAVAVAATKPASSTRPQAARRRYHWYGGHWHVDRNLWLVLCRLRLWPSWPVKVGLRHPSGQWVADSTPTGGACASYCHGPPVHNAIGVTDHRHIRANPCHASFLPAGLRPAVSWVPIGGCMARASPG